MHFNLKGLSVSKKQLEKVWEEKKVRIIDKEKFCEICTSILQEILSHFLHAFKSFSSFLHVNNFHSISSLSYLFKKGNLS
jgi:hypothetical protein